MRNWQGLQFGIRGRTNSQSARIPKKQLTLRLDVDVIEKFKATGPGWQARMNEVLKAAKVTK